MEAMKAAIHLGPNYLANLEVYKNTNFGNIQSFYSFTQKLILDHSEEIQNVNTIESASPSWTRSVLSHEQVIQWTKSKVCVYSDSFLCLGKMNQSEDGITKCEGQVEEFKMSLSYKEQLGIDGEQIEFEWHIRPGFSSLQILQKIQDVCENGTSNLRSSHTGSSSCQCSTTSTGKEKGNEGICISNSKKSRNTRKKSLAGILDVSRSWRRVWSSSLYICKNLLEREKP